MPKKIYHTGSEKHLLRIRQDTQQGLLKELIYSITLSVFIHHVLSVLDRHWFYKKQLKFYNAGIVSKEYSKL